MRVRVEVAKTPQGWEIRYPNVLPTAAPVAVDLVKAATITLPRTAQFDPSVAANRDLALNVTTLKTPAQGDVAKFGGYLFDVLLGAAWDEIQTLAVNDPVETIELLSQDPEFHRLPWEMARNAGGFLAKQGIGFVRVVPSANAASTVTVSPRVLFVVGSDLNDKRVKAGAEYLGLMKRLEATNMVLETQVLVRATRKSIEETVKRVRPSIVVFICHGSIGANGAGQLELTPEDRSQRTDFLSGRQLCELLDGIPQAVVMNACETGASSRSSVPLAWEMVSDKIPLAIGMTGSVSDRACRLFSRKFFEALLRNEDVHAATAQARREGMLHGNDPEMSVDWAMPALFMLDGVKLNVDQDAVAVMKARAQRANYFRKISNPLVVCGRTECVAAYSAILGTPADVSAPRTLALRVTEKYEGEFAARYGKTRAMEELAAVGALWGHVPCFVRKPSATLWELGRDILTGIVETRAAFGLPEVASHEFLKLKAYLTTGAGQVSPSVQMQLDLRGQAPVMQMEQAHPKVLLTALQADLAALARDAAAQKGYAQAPRVVVFIDDLHFSPAAEQLMTQWVSSSGLGAGGAADPQIVPLVFTYSSVDREVFRQVAAAIRTVAEAQSTQIASVDLRSLPSPSDDELPYKQFLLSQEQVLMLAPNGNLANRETFLSELHSSVMGVPSRLVKHWDNRDVEALVRAAFKYSDVLVAADDEQIVAQMAQSGAPNGIR